LVPATFQEVDNVSGTSVRGPLLPNKQFTCGPGVCVDKFLFTREKGVASRANSDFDIPAS
jgi:hypothetical protein